MAEVVRRTAGRHQFEQDAAGKRLSPGKLVIPPKCWTVNVRIFVGPPRGVGSEVEGDVDSLAQAHISTVHPSATVVADHTDPAPTGPPTISSVLLLVLQSATWQRGG